MNNHQENELTTQPIETVSTKASPAYQGRPRKKIPNARPKVMTSTVTEDTAYIGDNHIAEVSVNKLNVQAMSEFVGSACPPRRNVSRTYRNNVPLYQKIEGFDIQFDYLDTACRQPILKLLSINTNTEELFTFKQVGVLKRLLGDKSPAIFDEYIKWVLQNEKVMPVRN